jgi:hypothetical protein
MDRQPARSFKDLVVWQKAHKFVLLVYKLSNDFSKSELYLLTCTFLKLFLLNPEF